MVAEVSNEGLLQDLRDNLGKTVWHLQRAANTNPLTATTRHSHDQPLFVSRIDPVKYNTFCRDIVKVTLQIWCLIITTKYITPYQYFLHLECRLVHCKAKYYKNLLKNIKQISNYTSRSIILSISAKKNQVTGIESINRNSCYEKKNTKKLPIIIFTFKIRGLQLLAMKYSLSCMYSFRCFSRFTMATGSSLGMIAVYCLTSYPRLGYV